MTGKPRMSWPNRITVLRLLLIAPFVMAMLHINDPQYTPWARYAAIAMFLIMAVSDAIDGFLARKYNSVTHLGAFLDPLADKLLIVCACLLLAAESTAVPGMVLPDLIVVIIIAKDLYTVLGFLMIYLITSEMKIVPVTIGKLSTILQISLVASILIWPDIEPVLPQFGHVIVVLWWSAAAAAILTVIIYTRNGSRYIAEFEHRQRAISKAKNHNDSKSDTPN